jgi:hypothetical protein
MSVYRVNSNGTLGTKFAQPSFNYGSPGKGIAIDADSYALFQSMGSVYHTNNYRLDGTAATGLGTYTILDLTQQVVTVPERSLAVTKTSTTGFKSYAICNSSSPYVKAYKYSANSNGFTFSTGYSNPQIGISGNTLGLLLLQMTMQFFVPRKARPFLLPIHGRQPGVLEHVSHKL